MVKNDFKYTMSKTMANEYISTIKDKKLKGNKQKLLCEWVNNNFGIIGNCIEVNFF